MMLGQFRIVHHSIFGMEQNANQFVVQTIEICCILIAQTHITIHSIQLPVHLVKITQLRNHTVIARTIKTTPIQFVTNVVLQTVRHINHFRCFWYCFCLFGISECDHDHCVLFACLFFQQHTLNWNQNHVWNGLVPLAGSVISILIALLQTSRDARMNFQVKIYNYKAFSYCCSF